MTSNDGMLEAAARRPRDRDELAQRLYDGRSEPRIATFCPPVVDYSRELQTRAAEEVVLLPEWSAVAEMLSDYAVTREQVRACSRP